MCKRAKAWICIQYIWVSFLPAGWGEKICCLFLFYLILITLRQIFWYTGFQAVLFCMFDLRFWDFHVDVFAYNPIELPREEFVTFIMFSSPSPLADFDNKSSPHSQGCPPGPDMGRGWARRCMAAFAPGQGVGAGAEQSRALSTTVVSRRCRLALLPCSQRLWIIHLSISFNWKQFTRYSLATGLSVATPAAGLWSQWVPLVDNCLRVFSYLLKCL